MMVMPSTSTTTIRKIGRSARRSAWSGVLKVARFAGQAGCSLPCPSDQPLSSELRQKVVERLGATSRVAEAGARVAEQIEDGAEQVVVRPAAVVAVAIAHQTPAT